MSKLFKELWHTITHSYHPERHYMRGNSEQYLADAVDLCDLERRQQFLYRKGIY
jgi:hypothetical protein|tara:strand:- start:207 stop:368 length:162 start_codon:yes stop_codon:yes gene_type:complete